MSAEAIPTSFDREAFEDSLIEPDETRIRQELGLRPTHFAAGIGCKGIHPSQVPCPAWCWLSGRDEDDHEVDPNHPTLPNHSMTAAPVVQASLYPGGRPCSTYQFVTASAFEPELRQIGQGEAEVHIAARMYEGHGSTYTPDLMRLSLEDARELALVLNYLVDLAQRG